MNPSIIRCALALSLLIGPIVAAQAAPSAHEAQVRDFIAAFNAHDPEAMMALVTDDIEWLSVSGTAIATDALGKDTLRRQMTDYFAGCPTCRSRLSEVVASSQRVVTVEVASWQGKAGPREQRGVAVYEFADGKIRRVYYFPAEP